MKKFWIVVFSLLLLSGITFSGISCTSTDDTGDGPYRRDSGHRH